MPETEQNKQSDFMIEKIKERPVNKKKLLRRTIITAAMAVIFGLIACLTFLILEPVFNNWLYPEEDPPIIVFPEETDEMLPKDMVVEEETKEPSLQETVESVILEEEQIRKILSNISLDVNNYKQLYKSLSEYSSGLVKSMVTVTGVTSDTDWFNTVYESKNQTSGAIIYNNGKELVILADRSAIKQAQKITVTFSTGTQVEAVEKQYETILGLTVLSVPLTEIPPETMQEIQVANLGSSNARNLAGTPVIAAGSPMGTVNSVNYGMITSSDSSVALKDANYRLLLTNMYGSQNASGMLFNMQGEIIGVISNGRTGADMKNIVSAIAITELKTVISKMSNGNEISYLGISGMDVTQEANTKWNVPYGAFIKDVAMDSPAMLAGVQKGDVIISLNDAIIATFADYTASLLQLDVGDTVKLVVKRQVQDTYKEMEFDIALGSAK